MPDAFSKSIRFVSPGETATANYTTLNTDANFSEQYYMSEYENKEKLIEDIQKEFKDKSYNSYAWFVEQCIEEFDWNDHDESMLINWYYVRVISSYRNPDPQDDSQSYGVWYHIMVDHIADESWNEFARYIQWTNLFEDTQLSDFLDLMDPKIRVVFRNVIYNNMKRMIEQENSLMLWSARESDVDLNDDNTQDQHAFDSLLRSNPTIMAHLSQHEAMGSLQHMHILTKYLYLSDQSFENMPQDKVMTKHKELAEELVSLKMAHPTYASFISSNLASYKSISKFRLNNFFGEYALRYLHTNSWEDTLDVESLYNLNQTQKNELYQEARPLFVDQMQDILSGSRESELYALALDRILDDLYNSMRSMSYWSVHTNVVGNAIMTRFQKNIRLDFEWWYLYADDLIQQTDIYFRVYKTVQWRDVLVEDGERVINLQPTEILGFSSIPVVTHIDKSTKISIRDILARFEKFDVWCKLKITWAWDENVTRIKMK